MSKKILLGVFVLALIFTFGSMNAEKVEAGYWSSVGYNLCAGSPFGDPITAGGGPATGGDDYDRCLSIDQNDDDINDINFIEQAFKHPSLLEVSGFSNINELGDMATSMMIIKRDKIKTFYRVEGQLIVSTIKTKDLINIGVEKLLDPDSKDRVCKMYPTAPDCRQAMQTLIIIGDYLPDLLIKGAETLLRSIPPPVCGNGICEGPHESVLTCPADCAASAASNNRLRN